MMDREPFATRHPADSDRSRSYSPEVRESAAWLSYAAFISGVALAMLGCQSVAIRCLWGGVALMFLFDLRPRAH